MTSAYVYGKIVQHDCFAQYEPNQNDSCFPTQPVVKQCKKTEDFTDWNACTYYKCGSGFGKNEYRSCCQPDPSLCPMIGGIDGIPLWAGKNPEPSAYDVGGVCTPSGARDTTNILCRYFVSDFQTTEDVTLWTNTFVKNPTNSKENIEFSTEQLNTQLLPSYCLQPADPGDCPAQIQGVEGPSCPNGLTGCSRVVAKGGDANICPQWYNDNQNVGRVAAGNYCNTYTCATDCQCYNRAKVDNTFIQISPYAPPLKEGCWYVPCKSAASIFVPKDVDPGTGPSVCPTTICQSVVNFIDDHITNFNINNLNQSISCCANGVCGGSSSSIWAQYWKWIVMGLAMFVAVIIVVIIVSIVATNSGKNKIEDSTISNEHADSVVTEPTSAVSGPTIQT